MRWSRLTGVSLPSVARMLLPLLGNSPPRSDAAARLPQTDVANPAVDVTINVEITLGGNAIQLPEPKGRCQ